MKKTSFLSLLFLLGLAHAQTRSGLSPTALDPVDGNQIPEPELKDYQSAQRSPGILVQPYDVVDASGQPAEF